MVRLRFAGGWTSLTSKKGELLLEEVVLNGPTDRPQVVRGRRSSRSGLRPEAKAKAKKADAEAKATKVAAAEAEALRLEQERTAAAETARIAAEEEAAMAGTAKKTWYRSRMPGRDRPEAVHKTL